MTREEAIEVYNGLINTKIKEAFEFFAPELREINEEEIRKDIIGGLMWQRDNLKSEGPHDNNLILPGFCLTVGKHLSYLEKKKEQIKVVIPKFRVGDIIHNPRQAWQGPLKIRSIYEHGYNFDTVNTPGGGCLGFAFEKEYDLVKKEQTEKQDYSGLNDLERAILRGFLSAQVHNVSRVIIEETAKEVRSILQKEQKPTDLPAGFYYIDSEGNKYYSKEFRYGDMKLKVGEQKPVEYKPKAGEDIYHAINEAIGLAIDIQRSVSLCFNGVTLNVFPESCISEIVSYYHEQVKDDIQREKPAWSEEDEKLLNLTKTQLRILQSHLSHKHSESMSDLEYSSRMLQIETCVSWLDIRLKSLRPQPRWKPSEEQISSLKQARDYYMSGRIKYVGRHLSEIAEQLEKLM